MREAFGGTFMLKIAMVFLVIYVGFMAGAVSYAKAFRVKNQVINILEQHQYNGEDTTKAKIDEYLAGVPYNNTDRSKCSGGSYTDRGVCIIDMGAGAGTSSNQKYYKVIVFINIDLNFLNVHVNVPISGETKTIYTS